MADLFGNQPAAIDARSLPLAERMRPGSIGEIVGQRHLLTRILRQLVNNRSREQASNDIGAAALEEIRIGDVPWNL